MSDGQVSQAATIDARSVGSPRDSEVVVARKIIIIRARVGANDGDVLNVNVETNGTRERDLVRKIGAVWP